jgi:hypothetical protein
MNIRFLFSILILPFLFTGCKKDKTLDHPDIRLVTGIKRIWAVDDGEKIKR